MATPGTTAASPPGMNWKKFGASKLLHVGPFVAMDLALQFATDKESSFGHKLMRTAGFAAAMFIAPAALNAYWAAEAVVGVTKMLGMAAEMDTARFGQAITPGFTNHDIFSTNLGQLTTDRQRAVTAIQTQVFNARSSLGSEATRMRRDVNDYLR